MKELETSYAFTRDKIYELEHLTLEIEGLKSLSIGCHNQINAAKPFVSKDRRKGFESLLTKIRLALKREG